MPELPEVETVRRTLKNLIIGKTISKVDLYYEKIIDGNVLDFKRIIEGQDIEDIQRVGKYLVFILNHDAFISHLRMEGKFRFIKGDVEPEKHDHVIFHFTDGSTLIYQDTRKFGRMALVHKENFHSQLPLSKLGPEPWQADLKEIYRRIHNSKLPIKTLLLDQSIMTGIGNIYANEICFVVGISPKTPGNRLTKKKVEKIIIAAQEILSEAIKQGGTTIHTFDANGISGLFQVQLHVHMQKKCPICGGEITKEQVKGRGTYYCEKCQQ